MRGFRRPPGAAAAVAGGTLVLVLLVVDLAVGTGSAALIPLLLAGPALAAVTSPPRLTLWVALL
ncbi:MAG: hypothetical protein ACXVFT_21715, partial [Solirubrobacteraceae bacterium]